jgi:hypothetical protein
MVSLAARLANTDHDINSAEVVIFSTKVVVAEMLDTTLPAVFCIHVEKFEVVPVLSIPNSHSMLYTPACCTVML